MGDRLGIDDASLVALDRAWRGASEGIMWPLTTADAVHPVSAMIAWARAGARDPRCLWWVLARFGAEAMVEAAEGLEEQDRLRAIGWMCQQAQDVWIEDQPVTVDKGWRYRLDPSGAHIWEKGGEG